MSDAAREQAWQAFAASYPTGFADIARRGFDAGYDAAIARAEAAEAAVLALRELATELADGIQGLANAQGDWNEDIPLHCTADEYEQGDQGCRFCGTVDAAWIKTCPWRKELGKVVTALAKARAEGLLKNNK